MILWILRGSWIKSGMSPHLVLTWLMIEVIVVDLPVLYFLGIQAGHWLENIK